MKDGREVWYYRAWDGNIRIPGQCTGLTSKTEARTYCNKLKADGKLIPSKVKAVEVPKIPTLREWAESEHWWVWGEGPGAPRCRYLRAQLARSEEDKPAVSRRYADDALRELKKWILPYHGDKRLDEITPKDCEDLLIAWQEGKLPKGESKPRKPLSRKSINNKASIHRIMMSEAERLRVIDETPWLRVKGFKPGKHPKGILSIDEARRLFNPSTTTHVWKENQIYYSASLLSSVTGMRLGEVLALKRSDIFPDHVHVAGIWAIKYGLGKTKTKRIDDIPIPRFVYDAIDSWCAWEGFIFSFQRGVRPVSGNRTLGALYEALDRIGIPKEERTRRTITFHSWRAFANTYMRARGISGEKVRQLTRHDSEEMTEHYSAFRLEDFKDVAAAQEALVASYVEPEVTAVGGGAKHLASAIHFEVDEFHTFDEGKKGGRSLLSLDGDVAGHRLRICKPPVGQMQIKFFETREARPAAHAVLKSPIPSAAPTPPKDSQ
jgi:integrase